MFAFLGSVEDMERWLQENRPRQPLPLSFRLIRHFGAVFFFSFFSWGGIIIVP